MAPTRREDIKQTLALVKEHADLFTVVQKIGSSSLRPRLLFDANAVIFKTRLESLLQGFSPIEKSAIREQVRKAPQCSGCLQNLFEDKYDLVHLCDPKKCLVLQPRTEEPYAHACDPILCSRIVCDPACCSILCLTCIDSKMEAHYTRESMFGFFWMRQRHTKWVAPGSLALRMHAWQLVLGSTYLQDFVRSAHPGGHMSDCIEMAIESLWCQWCPRCECSACPRVITSTAFRLSARGGVLRILCTDCFEHHRTCCALCETGVYAVTSYKRLGPQIYTHWPLCRGCMISMKKEPLEATSVALVDNISDTPQPDSKQKFVIDKNVRALLYADTNRNMVQGNMTPLAVIQLLDQSNGRCALCQVRLTWGVTRFCKKQPTDFSINRVRNDAPHDMGNIMICCWACNMAYRTCAFCNLASTDRAYFVVWGATTVCLSCIGKKLSVCQS